MDDKLNLQGWISAFRALWLHMENMFKVLQRLLNTVIRDFRIIRIWSVEMRRRRRYRRYLRPKPKSMAFIEGIGMVFDFSGAIGGDSLVEIPIQEPDSDRKNLRQDFAAAHSVVEKQAQERVSSK